MTTDHDITRVTVQVLGAAVLGHFSMLLPSHFIPSSTLTGKHYSYKLLAPRRLELPFKMSQATYHIENAPGKVYGKNSDELIFKEPTSHAHIYTTTTTDTGGGLLQSTSNPKKHLFRGPPSEKEGGVCVATIDEPRHGTLAMHHGGDAAASTALKLTKTTSWVPLSGNNNHSVTFRGSTYTWSGRATMKRDRDSRVVAKVTGGWFFQGKLADIEVEVPEDVGGKEGDGGREQGRRETLEMVLASFVLRWWGDKVEEEAKAEEKREAAKEQKEVKKAVAREKKEAKEEEKAVKKQKEAEVEEVTKEVKKEVVGQGSPAEALVMGP